MITIDGSFGVGGGQILRTALSLAAITGQAVTIDNIRAARDKPGLRPQHITGALAVARICGGELSAAEVGSTKLIFKPGKIQPGNYDIDVSAIRASAGSVNLVLQTILWPLAFAGKKSRVTIKGGTHNPHAPTSNYIDETFLPAVADMGLRCTYSLLKAGYYPIGGGEVRVEIPPVEQLTPITVTVPDDHVHIELTSAVSNLPVSIAERQLETAKARLKRMGIESENAIKQYASPGKGTVVFLSLTAGEARGGFQSLGELKKRAERVADEACDELESHINTGMALDKHLADQLIIPISLANGNSKFTTSEITSHLITNITIVETFLPARFRVTGTLGQPGTVERIE